MSTLTMMIGLPRSGKSTWVEVSKGNAVVVSADSMRILVYGQRFWKGGESLMWSIRDMFLKMLLQQDVDIVIDETNITVAGRAKIIKLAKSYGYSVIGYVLSNSVEVCIERAIESDMPDLVPIIQKMKEDFEEPEMKEGFDDIYLI